MCANENRAHQSHIGKVRTSRIRIVQNSNITRAQFESIDHGSNRIGSAPEMNRDMRRLRYQARLSIEERAGKIPPLTNIDAHRGATQEPARLLAHGGKKVVEDLKTNGIGLLVDGHLTTRIAAMVPEAKKNNSLCAPQIQSRRTGLQLKLR